MPKAQGRWNKKIAMSNGIRTGSTTKRSAEFMRACFLRKPIRAEGGQLNLLRFTRFIESCAYFSPAHAYSLHVSFLGLFPILMSDNTSLKREAIQKLEAGGLFALGVSEANHGSDLLSNEFTATPTGSGDYRAEGSKYYIGNANAACMISILGKKAAPGASGSKRAPLIIFALRPEAAPGYQNVKKIRTLGIRSAFVGQFDVKAHPFPEQDVIAEAREAWDAIFATVNLGKFFLGFGAIGICERAMAQAVQYLQQRVLYGKPVADMQHIRIGTAYAFARLLAMKLYAFRALDYVQAATADDRRFLLFNAVQKARVSMQGVRVIELLTECVGARAFETHFRFESAACAKRRWFPCLKGAPISIMGLPPNSSTPISRLANANSPRRFRFRSARRAPMRTPIGSTLETGTPRPSRSGNA